MTVSPTSPDDRANDVFEAWLVRLEAGEQEAPGVVLAAHPEIAAQLRARFDAMSLMDRALSAPEEAGPPERLGDFRIVREIARGGMGVVYEAEQEDMGRRVALKVLFPSMFPTSRAVERFQQEARAAGRLKHTNIVAGLPVGYREGALVLRAGTGATALRLPTSSTACASWDRRTVRMRPPRSTPTPLR